MLIPLTLTSETDVAVLPYPRLTDMVMCSFVWILKKRGSHTIIQILNALGKKHSWMLDMNQCLKSIHLLTVQMQIRSTRRTYFTQDTWKFLIYSQILASFWLTDYALSHHLKSCLIMSIVFFNILQYFTKL